MKSILAIALSCCCLCIFASEEYSDQFNYGQASGKGKDWIQVIKVLAPEYRSSISGKTTIRFQAPGMDKAEARCWHQADDSNSSPWGYDAIVLPARDISNEKEISFTFDADTFPHGPINIRIATQNKKGKRDLCELQLYNKNGVKWKYGAPNEKPPAAKDLELVFADDFESMPSISKLGIGTTYMGHKPPDGSQDFSGYRFSHKDDYPGAHDPYEQMGTWLRIKARGNGDKKTWGSGIFAPMDVNYNGVAVKPPFYMECRMTAQSAPGTWPAFWTLTIPNPDIPGCDELDIIEGYGGLGPGNPNDNVGYHCVSHFWGQPEYKKQIKGKYKTHTRAPMMTLGGKSFWSTTFHTYGVYVDEKDTVYYFDNHEVLRHPSGPVSQQTAAYFLINYAIGGISGWKIDLKRYGNATDMWVDWVRVYSASLPAPRVYPKTSYFFNDAVEIDANSSSPQAQIHYTTDGSTPTAASPKANGTLKIKQACTVKIVAIAPGLKPSAVSTATVKAALPAAKVDSAQSPGLTCDYYEGKWKAIPDFTSIKMKHSSVTKTVQFPEQRAADHFALRFTGYITIPADGQYTFYTNSDDGSQLFIDGELVVDNDGLHGAIERKGTIGLHAGTHTFEVRYLEAWGGESLTASWSFDGQEKTTIPASVFSHSK